MKVRLEQLMRRAKQQARAGNVDQAIVTYQTILQAYPQNKRARQLLAKLQGGGGRSKSPDQNDPPMALQQQLADQFNQGSIRDVIIAAMAATEDHPKSAFLWHLIGAAHAALQQYETAKDAFEQAILHHPGFFDAYANLAACLRDMGDFGAAINRYQQALDLKPDDINARHNLGVTYKMQGQMAAAIDCYHTVIAIEPDHLDAHINLGVALKAAGDLDAAVASYQRALDIKPEFAQTHYNLGNALKEQGHLPAALASFDRALALNPDYAEAQANKGQLLLMMGDFKQG